MTIFIVTIADFPEIYKKMEIINEEFYGDDKLVCPAFYISKIIITTTDILDSL
jgi:hypothetical protein